MEKTSVKPYNTDKSKKEEVTEMFDNISAKYDFLNHFLSLGIDHLWRRKAVKKLQQLKPKRILDLATGTGDFAIALLALKPTQVIGMDISPGMLSVGKKKMFSKKVSLLLRVKI